MYLSSISAWWLLLAHVVHVCLGATCAGQSSELGCMEQAQAGLMCSWNSITQLCDTDPCTQYTSPGNCAGNGCLSIPWNAFWGSGAGTPGPTCISQSLLCNQITELQVDCAATGFCMVQDQYCVPLIANQGSSTTNCGVSFPSWSVVLIVIWIAAMLTLAFVGFVIHSKGRSRMKSMEQLNPLVDSTALRDNFNLEQPMAR